MRSATLILSLVAAIAAEAPYHLPRPAVHSPAFNYPSAPAPAPVPILRPQPPPIPHHHVHHQPAPQPNFVQGSGYQYQQPSIQPAFVQPAPQVQYQPVPQPQYQPAPQPQYQPAPQPQYQPAPQPQYQPAPLPRYQPQPLPQQLQTFYAPAPAPAPQPLPQSINYPSTSYGVPQAQIAPRPILPQPLPNYVQSQPAPLPINYYQNQQQSQGYSNAQPFAQSIQTTANLPLQSQATSINFGNSGVSSYQTDSNSYSSAQAQTHSEALDSIVVNHVQNIIKDNEHATAKNAGYLSLVSGVSLENVKPSVEISSFVQSAPLTSSELSASSISSSSRNADFAVSAPSSDYGLPTITANSQSAATGFLPNAKSASL